MSRLEANISLLIITLLGAVQYVFLANVPESVSHFAFLCITNLVGFLITLAFFFGELFRLDRRQIFQSMLLSAELVLFNLFMLIGAKGISTTIMAAVLSSYFMFVVIISAVMAKKLPTAGTIAGAFSVLAGLFLMTNADIRGLMNANVFYLIAADIAFAAYVMSVGAYAPNSNPSILAMGQMFFCFVFSLLLWLGEAVFFGASLTLPEDPAFWGSVIYVSFVMRGLYGIVQIYAQRYVTPLNTSLIFSTEIIMTMLLSPLMTRFFGTPPEIVTSMKAAGSIMIVAGLLITEPVIYDSLRRFGSGLSAKITERAVYRAVLRLVKTGISIRIVIICAVTYILLDYPVQMIGIMPVHAGIKNFLPLTLGLFFGLSGVTGCCFGCIASFMLLGLPPLVIFTECMYIIIIGMGMWYGWFAVSGSKRVSFRSPMDFVKYSLLVIALSLVCLDMKVTCSYIILGLLVSLPVNILFGNILGIEPVLPDGSTAKPDTEFVLDANSETLEAANEMLEEAGEKAGAKMKQVLEIQSCIEELSIRMLGAEPDAEIHVAVHYDYAVSVKMSCNGRKHNPFRIEKGEDVLDIMSLEIIKHRALRASYSYKNGENFIHVIV